MGSFLIFCESLVFWISVKWISDGSALIVNGQRALIRFEIFKIPAFGLTAFPSESNQVNWNLIDSGQSCNVLYRLGSPKPSSFRTASSFSSRWTKISISMQASFVRLPREFRLTPQIDRYRELLLVIPRIDRVAPEDLRRGSTQHE